MLYMINPPNQLQLNISMDYAFWPANVDLSSVSTYSDLFFVLGRQTQHIVIMTKHTMQTGCSAQVPTCCDKRPVMNGTNAPPELPTDAMNENAETCL